MDQLAIWRNIAVLVLAVQCLVGIALMLALSYLLVRLMNVAQGKAESGAARLRKVSRTVAEQSDLYAGKVTAPVIAARQRITRVQTSLQSLIPGSGRRKTPGAAPPIPPGTVQQ